jgi:hypothetical protein
MKTYIWRKTAHSTNNNINNNNNNNNDDDREDELIDKITPETMNENDIKNINKNDSECVSTFSLKSNNKILRINRSSSQIVSHVRGGNHNNNTSHISIMLFAVSIGFVILNLPFALRQVFHLQFADYLYHNENFFETKTSKTEINDAIKYEFVSSLTHFLLDLNYIANFFLYFLSGSRFRDQLFYMLRLKKRNPINTKHTTIAFS